MKKKLERNIVIKKTYMKRHSNYINVSGFKLKNKCLMLLMFFHFYLNFQFRLEAENKKIVGNPYKIFHTKMAEAEYGKQQIH
jgi:hypothetical protein